MGLPGGFSWLGCKTNVELVREAWYSTGIMKPHVAIGALGLGLMFSPLLTSMGRTAVPASPKIGVIDLDNTLSTTPAGKRANDAFEKTRKTKQTQLDKDQDDLKRAAADLEKQKAGGETCLIGKWKPWLAKILAPPRQPWPEALPPSIAQAQTATAPASANS